MDKGPLASRTLLMVVLVFASPGAVFAPEPRPSISGIFSVTIKASDVEKAKSFYEEALKLPRAPNCLRKEADCLMIGLFQRLEIVPMGENTSSTMIEPVTVLTSNAASLRSYLTARGQRPGKLITDPCGWQEYFDLTDPDQHQVVFVKINWGMAGTFRPAEISPRMIHSGFVVKDRAAEDKFYKDILGFHVYWHGGMKDGEDNWVDMQVPDGTDWIEYMLGVSPSASHKTLGVMNHIALGVPDIHAAREQLIKNGWNGTEEPKIGRDGKWQLNLYDPDETRVELMEFTPTQKPCCAEYTGPHPGTKP